LTSEDKMKKALIHLKEDLPSTIGFHYAAAYTKQSGMDLQVIHVVEPDPSPRNNAVQPRPTGEKEIIAAGLDEVHRLMRTENIEYCQAGEPKIMVGDKDQEILDELQKDSYSVYFEGYLTTDKHSDFLNFLNCRRFREVPCPLLIVKDLASISNLFLLVNNEVDGEKIVSGLNSLYAISKKNINLTVLYYTYKKGRELLFVDKNETGPYLDHIGRLLEQSGWNEPEWIAVQGSPHKTAEYIHGYGLVATAFPAKISPRAELIARLTNPVFLLSQ